MIVSIVCKRTYLCQAFVRQHVFSGLNRCRIGRASRHSGSRSVCCFQSHGVTVILDPARRLSDDSPTRAGSSADSRGPVHSDAEPARAALEQQKTVVSKLPPVGLHSAQGQGSGGESANALAGVQLGHFSLETLVGGGGMGSVYRATDTSLGRTVAVKVVAPNQSADETLARFKNEAQSAARLDHPNIAQVFLCRGRRRLALHRL